MSSAPTAIMQSQSSGERRMICTGDQDVPRRTCFGFRQPVYHVIRLRHWIRHRGFSTAPRKCKSLRQPISELLAGFVLTSESGQQNLNHVRIVRSRDRRKVPHSGTYDRPISGTLLIRGMLMWSFR
jgi:hypothetical protein